MTRATARQIGTLARRSVVRTLRQPAMVVPALFFPLLLLAVNAGGLQRATELPGFPADHYIDFVLAVCFVQGGLFAANSAGTNVASDVESGFLNRLSLTPLSRTALLVGQLAGVLALGLIQASTFLVVGAIAGEGIHSGVAGALVIVALARRRGGAAERGSGGDAQQEEAKESSVPHDATGAGAEPSHDRRSAVRLGTGRMLQSAPLPQRRRARRVVRVRVVRVRDRAAVLPRRAAAGTRRHSERRRS